MKVNGKDLSTDSPMSLADFVTSAGYDVQRIAVELNGAIIPKNSFSSTVLNDDDSLEIVTFVGGG